MSRGVHVAIGHTHADPDQIRDASDADASFATYLGNRCHAILPRHPDYLWAQLAEDRRTAGFIADGHHRPDDTLIAMIRAKGCTRSVLVSDSVTLAGSPPGRYVTPVGGEVELHPGGRSSPLGRTILAGRREAWVMGWPTSLTRPPSAWPALSTWRPSAQTAFCRTARVRTAAGDAHLDIESTYVGGEVVHRRT